MIKKLSQYAFINAKLRAKISKIFTHEFYETLSKSKSLDEAVQLFTNTEYDSVIEVYNQTGNINSVELHLKQLEIQSMKGLEKHLNDDLLNLIKVFLYQFEIEQLKNILRLWYDRAMRDRDISEQILFLDRTSIVHTLNIDGIITSESIQSVVENLRGTPYAEVIQKRLIDFENKKNLFPVEIALDHYFYELLFHELQNIKGNDYEIAQRLLGVQIDVQNINWILRFKEFYSMPIDEVLKYKIPYGFHVNDSQLKSAFEEKDLNQFLGSLVRKKYSNLNSLLMTESSQAHSKLILMERILDEILQFEIKHILMGDPFTIGILLAYFIIKQNEIKKIITVLNAVVYQIPEEEIIGLL